MKLPPTIIVRVLLCSVWLDGAMEKQERGDERAGTVFEGWGEIRNNVLRWFPQDTNMGARGGATEAREGGDIGGSG